MADTTTIFMDLEPGGEMGLTQRKAPSTVPAKEAQHGHRDESNPMESVADKKAGNQRAPFSRRKHSSYVLMGMSVMLFFLYFFLSKLAWLRCLTLSPIIFCLWLVVEPDHDRNFSQRLLPLALVTTAVSAQLPGFLGALIASLVILAFGLATIPATAGSKGAEGKQIQPESALPVVSAVLLMIAMLLLDNFFVWVVSATFKPGQSVITAPEALQDNGQLVMKWALSDLTKREVVGLRRLWNVQNGLIACLGASFVSLEVFSEQGRTLFRVSRRAVLTLAAARFIRVVSFVLTVLPSQTKRCYFQRFPAPPEEWMEWILVGFRPYSHGGCNDLIISGHATVVSVLACISASIGADPYFQACLWSLVALDFAVEIYEGFHYSVDMFLGTVLVCLLWRVLATVEGTNATSPVPRLPFREVPKQTIGLYCLPVIGAYAQLTILPHIIANPVIILYALVAFAFLLASLRNRKTPLIQAAYQHAAQHTLLCLLFLAFGVYF